ncbi:MAG: SDR family oxidoreductase [Bacillus sp. (in: firmicutes)]
MKFLVLGATGMAGHTICIYLKEQGHEVVAFSRTDFPYCINVVGDVSDLNLVDQVIKDGRFDCVINCVGLLNQDAENNKQSAVFLNSYFPHYLSFVTRESKTKVIHMSTDCVFSGNEGNYSENAFKDGETFYDRSKALGELENDKDVTFRTSIIGPDMKKNGIGLFNWFMKQRGEICGFHRAIWTGVTTLTLAKAMEAAAQSDLVGLYHLVNNDTISKYELLKLFNSYFKDNEVVILKGDSVTLNKSLLNNRKDFDFVVPSYEDMIKEMRDWTEHHKELYPHYFG